MKLKKPTVKDLYVYIFITAGIGSLIYSAVKIAGWLIK